MLRIPTGKVPKNYARTISLALGVAGLAASFIPALAPFAVPIRELSALLGGLGLTLGSAGPQKVSVPK